MDIPNLTLPDYFINRELSALEFSSRVLAQARDKSIPILERLKFLCIVSTNLDEFFEIRVSGLQQRLESGATPSGPDLLSPHFVLQEIGERAHGIINEQYEVLNDEILPELENQGLRFIRRRRWTNQQRTWLREYFFAQIAPVLSPTSLDPGRPFPENPEQEPEFHHRAQGHSRIWSALHQSNCSGAALTAPHDPVTR